MFKETYFAKISVFQGNFTEGETEYFQVSKFEGGWTTRRRLLDPHPFCFILIALNYLSTCLVMIMWHNVVIRLFKDK